MAAPITHIFQAQLIYDKYLSDKSRKEFFIGTCFPDIRLTGVIDEEKTHFSNLLFSNIAKESPFWAGVKFHSIVDDLRKDFIALNNVHSALPKVDYIKESLKLFEDEYYYGQINNWSTYINFLKDILPEELEFGIKEKDIKNWHSIIINYLSSKPDDNSRMKFHIDMGFKADAVNIINKNILTLRTNENAIRSCQKLHSYILEKIQPYD